MNSIQINYVPGIELSKPTDQIYSGKEIEVQRDERKNSETIVLNCLVEQRKNRTLLIGLIEKAPKGRSI